MSSALHQLVVAQQRDALGPAAAARSARLDDSRVQVTIKARPGRTNTALAAVAALGGQPTASYRDQVDAWVPVSALPALAQQGAVVGVNLPRRPRPAVVSEGVQLVNAPAWYSAGLTGSGVKVAIVDLGFEGYTGKLGTELPASVDTSCTQQPLANGGPHGTAVAEIVHDVAPDAQLFLVNINTDTELGQAVTCLAEKGVHVINHSIIWLYQAAGDGSGFVNQIVDDAVLHGMFWANAAGNVAHLHWRGPWSDPNNNASLNFSGSDEFQNITVLPGDQVVIALRWDDTWGGACHDYDLFLWDNPDFLGSPVAWSTNVQDCSDGSEPLEWLVYNAPHDLPSGTYYIEVFRYAATGTHTFDLLSFYHPLEYPVAAYSLEHPADSRSAGMAAVGAVPWNNPSTLEFFSSQGPTTDGRIKPDLVAPDGVRNSVYASFYGTSAASPHVAGAAALVNQANPSFTPAQIRSFLQSRAIDLGPAGPDNQFGSGRVHLGSAPAGSTPTATSTGTRTPTLTPTATSTATSTPSLVPSATSTPTPTLTATSTATSMPTLAPTAMG
ncbi:MAG: S8 family serine peptidase, partial [Chloroflexota bacterium]|nr:S8 family serine peptidase [Chloroflexota bacterium]